MKSNQTTALQQLPEGDRDHRSEVIAPENLGHFLLSARS